MVSTPFQLHRFRGKPCGCIYFENCFQWILQICFYLCVRHPDARIGADALNENLQTVPTEHLYPSLDALNQLGSVPWMINNPVRN